MNADVINAMSALWLNGYITTMQAIKGGVQIMDTATPRVVTTIQQANKTGQVTSFSDRASTVDALLSVLAARNMLVVILVAPDLYDTCDANNRTIKILGTTRIDIFLNKRRITSAALVSRALPEDQLILGWRSLQDLGIILSHFPHPCTQGSQ